MLVRTTGIGKGRKWKKKMKIGGEKMRNATCSSQQGENELQWKEKANSNKTNKTFGELLWLFLYKMTV